MHTLSIELSGRRAVPSSDPDADILALVAGGQREAALRCLMKRHGDAVHRFCREALRDPARADDVHQEVFISAHRDLPAFARQSRLRTWLFAIARHRVLDEVKADARRRRRHERAEAYEVAEPSPIQSDQLDEASFRAALAAALRELPDETRAVVLLRYQQGLGYTEMAAICGESAGTLQARVARAMTKLHACIVRRTGEGPRA